MREVIVARLGNPAYVRNRQPTYRTGGSHERTESTSLSSYEWSKIARTLNIPAISSSGWRI